MLQFKNRKLSIYVYDLFATETNKEGPSTKGPDQLLLAARIVDQLATKMPTASEPFLLDRFLCGSSKENEPGCRAGTRRTLMLC
jgi:hypothetical protein